MIRVSDLDMTDRKTLFASLPRGLSIVEVGVDWGEFSAYILEVAEPRKLYLVDPWVHWPDPELKEDASNAAQPIKEAQWKQVSDRYRDDQRVEVMRLTSEQASDHFTGASLDLVYLDPDHRKAYQDCRLWWPLIRRGGAISGHDWCEVGEYIRVKSGVDRFASGGLTRDRLELFQTESISDRVCHLRHTTSEQRQHSRMGTDRSGSGLRVEAHVGAEQNLCVEGVTG